MTNQIYVISGANRGIGLELTRQLLKQGHQVCAGARKPSLELKALSESHDKLLKILELDVQSDASVLAFAKKLGLDHVDVLINNAGMYADGDGGVRTTPVKKLEDTLNTNALGPLRLTQALLPLLDKAKAPRIANISSQMGSIDDNSSGGAVAYRMSKSALNMLTKTLAVDEKKIISLALHPGWVQTNMGGKGAPLKTEASAEGLLKVIQGATLEASGNFLTYSGKELPW